MRSHMRGFTLVEILVVVTILAIVATIAIPTMGNYDTIRVPSAARMVMSDLLYAQNSAITTQNKTFVYFMNDTQTPTQRKAYTIAYFTGTPAAPNFTQAKDWTISGTSWTTGGKLLTQPTTQNRYLVQFGTTSENAPGPLSRTIIKSVTIGSTAATVFAFDSLGQPVPPNSSDPILVPITITLTNIAGDVTTTLTISPITGEINAQ